MPSHRQAFLSLRRFLASPADLLECSRRCQLQETYPAEIVRDIAYDSAICEMALGFDGRAIIDHVRGKNARTVLNILHYLSDSRTFWCSAASPWAAGKLHSSLFHLLPSVEVC